MEGGRWLGEEVCGVWGWGCRAKRWTREGLERLWRGDRRARGLSTGDAVGRGGWRVQIGMIDGHGGCGWVDVSSGIGSPGLSRTNSTEP